MEKPNIAEYKDELTMLEGDYLREKGVVLSPPDLEALRNVLLGTTVKEGANEVGIASATECGRRKRLYFVLGTHSAIKTQHEVLALALRKLKGQ